MAMYSGIGRKYIARLDAEGALSRQIMMGDGDSSSSGLLADKILCRTACLSAAAQSKDGWKSFAWLWGLGTKLRVEQGRGACRAATQDTVLRHQRVGIQRLDLACISDRSVGDGDEGGMSTGRCKATDTTTLQHYCTGLLGQLTPDTVIRLSSEVGLPQGLPSLVGTGARA
ncbi:MAG: hypothetical protein M1818_006328 [Claussenomyces sp. TS43310]|nr:MAG: hypothetical protein M1818_006328 [Claussenomyces sp. TS43310]